VSYKQYINTPSTRLTLDSVKYKKIEGKRQKKTVSVKSAVQDFYSVIEMGEGEIEIQFTRSVNFQPKAIMSAEVVLTIVFDLNRANREEVNDEIILEEVKQRAEELLIAAASNASSVISSLTNVSFIYPLVTPPFYTKDDDLLS